MNKGISHLDGFINWWDVTGHKQMLASESLGASMRIMTIHKAKGLASPVIIIPYCNWEFNHPAMRAPWLWVPTQGTPFNQVGMIPIRYDSSLQNSFFSNVYYREKIDAYLDSLNLLYVAFTRAIDVLIVFCTYGNGFKNVGDAMFDCLKDSLDEFSVYRQGAIDFMNPGAVAASVPESHLKTPMVSGKLKSTILHRALNDLEATRFGKNVHHILELVQSKADLPASIKRAVVGGYFTPEEAVAVEERIHQIFKIPEVENWFSEDWEILNEAAILVPGGSEKRPDRVMIRDQKLVVIDYKTGQPEPRHEKQVANYMLLLHSMGYENVKGYLLYIESTTLTEVKFLASSAPADPSDQGVLPGFL
jgi:ATP-dependent exoDNAse (exonuclease V) beta subunit